VNRTLPYLVVMKNFLPGFGAQNHQKRLESKGGKKDDGQTTYKNKNNLHFGMDTPLKEKRK